LTGTIDGEEIKTRLNELGIKVTDQNIRLLLEKMDKDGDVKINWEEWRDFLLLQPSTNWEDISKVWHHATFGDYPEITEEFTPNGLWWRQLLAGGAAGTVSRTCTAPLDRLKVFFQVQSMYSEGGRHPFTLKSCLRHMLNEGGVRSLWRGNGINVIKIAPETALRFFAYEKAKGFLKGDKPSNLKAHEKLLAGSTAGVIAQTTIYPMEVLKTRLALGRTGQYGGMSDCFRQIIRNEGWVGFYRGLTPSLLGIIPYAGIDLAVYETLKNLWLKSHDSSDPGILIPLACGTVSSTAGQLVSYPLSLLRTRLQAQTSPVRGEDKGLGMIDIFSTIIKEEGVSGLYRGLLPNFLKVIPAVSIGYVVYEQFKKILKVTSVK
jgi:solute carrier family 25 phosphate transporter 23/24/25/41